MALPTDAEANRLTARVGRYARVGANVGGVAARAAAARLFGREVTSAANGAEIARALGGLKGPLMKVAQLLATIPDAVPPEWAAELQSLQSEAPPMGAGFVARRMQAELGPGWRARFAEFDLKPAAAASLGQVHRATALDGERLAVKLQYPDMASAVEADLVQLRALFALFRRFDPSIDTTEIAQEIGDRVREELDYAREARHAALYALMLDGVAEVRVPRVRADLSTKRLLALSWLDGTKLLAHKDDPLEARNALALALFKAWWLPFARYGVIHGDPHLGNYTVFSEVGAGPASSGGDGVSRASGINLLDYGCIRVFPPSFVGGVVDLYRGFREDDEARVVHAYETWGFKGLSRDLIAVLNLWARFIYGPLLDDRVRTIADGIAPGEYGRREAFQVHKALKERGPVTVPREFVFMDRAAVGLGAVFLHLAAEMNFHRLFEEALEGFTLEGVAERQRGALAGVGLAPS